ncbi:hypothetical protein S40288_08523 [Stachybotrys chartarum IBT 40288]|nr:hypothetical protein S40288_08523 [Stachybotrys chartarum IBT 40288]
MPRSFAPGEVQVVVNAANWTMLSISTIFLALRVYCRAARSGQLWWDDYILLASWALMVSSTGVLADMLDRGYLDYNMSEPHLFLLTKIAHTCHLVSLALSKTSFAVTLLRFTNKWQKYILWFIIASINVLFTIHIFLLWRAMCGMSDQHSLGTCWDPSNAIIMNITSSMYSAITDFVLALLPWKVVMSLNMKKSEKISLAVAMSFGGIAGVTGIMKSIQSIYTLDFMDPEYMYNLTLFWIFSLAEPNTTIIAASVPVLRVLVRDVRTQLGGYSNSHPGASGYAGGYIKSTNNKFHQGEITSTEQTVVNTGDADSDRSILGHSSKGLHGISRTTEVTIEYGLKDDPKLRAESFEMSGYQVKNKTVGQAV